MAQLEDEDHLALLEPTVRHLIVVLAETGLRANDACTLPYNPLVDDSGGWPCLRYHARKVNADQLVPLSGRAAVAIRDQQAHVRVEWPTGIPWLFPDPRRRPEGPQPFSYDMLNRRLKSWQNKIDLRDQNGNPVRVTAHQFRHTVGTRFQRRRAPTHRAACARPRQPRHDRCLRPQLHDTTIRQVFDRYQQLRVNIAGEVWAFRGVATRAGVSRSWLYRDPDVRAEIERLRAAAPSPANHALPAVQRASTTRSANASTPSTTRPPDSARRTRRSATKSPANSGNNARRRHGHNAESLTPPAPAPEHSR